MMIKRIVLLFWLCFWVVSAALAVGNHSENLKIHCLYQQPNVSSKCLKKISRTEPLAIIASKEGWLKVEVHAEKGVVGWLRVEDFIDLKKSLAKLGVQVVYIRMLDQAPSRLSNYNVMIYKDGALLSANKAKRVYSEFKSYHGGLVDDFQEIEVQQFKYRHLRSLKQVEDPEFNPFIFLPLDKAHKLKLNKEKDKSK